MGDWNNITEREQTNNPRRRINLRLKTEVKKFQTKLQIQDKIRRERKPKTKDLSIQNNPQLS